MCQASTNNEYKYDDTRCLKEKKMPCLILVYEKTGVTHTYTTEQQNIVDAWRGDIRRAIDADDNIEWRNAANTTHAKIHIHGFANNEAALQFNNTYYLGNTDSSTANTIAYYNMLPSLRSSQGRRYSNGVRMIIDDSDPDNIIETII